MPGVQKSGTTFLRHVLMGHPHLQTARGGAGAAPDEPHFFDEDTAVSPSVDSRAYIAQSYSVKHFSESLKKYMEAPPRQMFDVTPTYTTAEKAIERIKKLLPWVRIVLVLRDPTDRYRSHLQMELQRAWRVLSRSKVPLNPSWGKSRSNESFPQPGAMAEWLLQAPQLAHHESFRNPILRGFYSDQVSMWLKHWRREEILVLRSEDLFADPHGQAASVFAFVGVPTLKSDMQEALKHKRPDAKASAAHAHSINMSQHFTTEDRKALSAFYKHKNRHLSELVGMDFPWLHE